MNKDTDQPADMQSIFKTEGLPPHVYELFKRTVLTGVCNGTEALLLFYYYLAPSIVYKKTEDGKVEDKRLYRDKWGNILAVPSELSKADCSEEEDGWAILKANAYSTCFSYSFWAPKAGKINAKVLVSSWGSQSRALATGTWERDAVTGELLPPSKNFSNEVLEIIKSATAKAMYEVIQLAHAQTKQVEEEKKAEPERPEFPLCFQEAVLAIASSQQGEDKVMVSKCSGYAYRFNEHHQLIARSYLGDDSDPDEMGIEDTEVCGDWAVMSLAHFNELVDSGKLSNE